MMRIAYRLLSSVLVLWAVMTLAFAIHQVLPGDAAQMAAGPQARPQEVARIRDAMGLDRPVIEQYARFMSRLVHRDHKDGEGAHATCSHVGPLHLDLGKSFQQRRPVVDIIAERLPRTLLLAVSALVVQLALGMGLALTAAGKPRSKRDWGVFAIAIVGVSTPTFVSGLFLQNVLATRLRLLPMDGYGKSAAEHLACVVLPALTLGVYGAAYFARFARDELVAQLAADYVRTARAKGASPGGVLVLHALRNALVPLITMAGLDLGTLVAGAIVTEALFRWPGLGSLTATALLDRDGPLVMGVVLVTSSAIIVANLMVDAMYALLDPRVRRY